MTYCYLLEMMCLQLLHVFIVLTALVGWLDCVPIDLNLVSTQQEWTSKQEEAL